jgi:general secretion pathway protein B
VSFILDALRKSEHERQRSAVPGLAQVPLATPPAHLPRWTMIVMGLLVAAVLALGLAWWQSAREPVELTAAPATVERPVPLPPAPAAPPERVATVRTVQPEPASPAPADSLATAAEPSVVADAPPPPAPTAIDEPVPTAAALAAEGIALPELRLELLAFREQPRDRFVFINGRKYVEGERLVEGPQLVSIQPTGAVLLQTGRRFLLLSQ